MWRCPHCGAPQAETARCWVCRRSSTTCSTCRRFRRSLAADVGWCALDPKRSPLTGRELRGCWQARSSDADLPAAEAGVHVHQRPRGAPAGAPPWDEPDAPPARDFVPVELLGPIVSRTPPAPAADGPTDAPALPLIAADPDESWADRTSLFGDSEA